MSLVPGIVAALPTGLPSAPTSCASTPRWPLALEYQAMTRPAGRVRGQVRVVAVLPDRRLVVVVRRRRREARVDPRAERAGEGLQRRAVPRTVAAVLLAYDWAPSGTTWPGWSAQLAPPSGDSAVFVSRCGSLESVVRKPPQKARRPPGSTTSAAFVKPVQPLWIGLVAPTLPRRQIAVWRRSSVFGPVGCDQARWSTPSPVRASPTWSVLAPSGVVIRFHGAALADGAAQAASSTTAAAARSVSARSAQSDTRPGRGRRR